MAQVSGRPARSFRRLAVATAVLTYLLIVMGGKDVMTPPASGRALRDLVPNARYVEIADAGHLAMLEAPDDVTRAIAEFVAD